MKGTLFADTLRAINDESMDWKRVVCEIAENHPEQVAKAIAGYAERNAWKSAVRNEASAGKVPAIKLMRTLTGASLLDAKQWVEGDSICAAKGRWDYIRAPSNNPYL